MAQESLIRTGHDHGQPGGLADADVVVVNESLDPVGVGLFGAAAVMAGAQRLVKLDEQLGLPAVHGRGFPPVRGVLSKDMVCRCLQDSILLLVSRSPSFRSEAEFNLFHKWILYDISESLVNYF